MALQSAGKLRRGLVALAIAVPALYAVSACTAIVQDYRSTIQQAESDVRNTAAALHEHAMRSFGEADIRLRVAIAEIEWRGLAPVAADERALHEILVRAGGDSPLAGSAGVLSPDGAIRASAFAYPMSPLDGRSRYRSLRLGESSRLVLVRRDGWVIWKHPSAPV